MGPLEYDLVDVTRQVLSNLFVDLHMEFRYSYERFTKGTNSTIELVAVGMEVKIDKLFLFLHVGSMYTVNSLGSKLLGVIKDIEKLLASNVNYLLGNWIHDARAWGTSKKEKALYEFNAR